MRRRLFRFKKRFIFALGEKERDVRTWEHRSVPDEDQRIKMTTPQNARCKHVSSVKVGSPQSLDFTGEHRSTESIFLPPGGLRFLT